MLKKCLLSSGLLFLYFCYFPLVRILGPALAMPLTRATTFLVWCATFFGADRRVRQNLRLVLPSLGRSWNVGDVHRGYIAVKQEQFVLQVLYPTRRGRRYVEKISRTVEGKEHLEAAVRKGRGVILATFHFGVFRVIHPALLSVGFDTYLHFLRSERYADRSFGWVARAVLARKIRLDQSADRRLIYHEPGRTYARIAELLRSNEIVQMLGDGMATSKSIEVPFLSGTMRFPTGLARLAADTGAAIVCLFPVRDSMKRHRIVLHPPIFCPDSSQGSIESAVRSYVRLLEEYVRRYPWMWWSWRRICPERDSKGAFRYILTETLKPETRIYRG